VSEQRERELLTEVHAAYLEALDGLHELVLARQYERLLKWLHEAAQARYAYGEISGVEVRLAQVEAARATADRLNAERNAVGALGRLATRIGLPEGATLYVHDDHPMPQPFPGATPERALAERRDLRVLRLDAALGEPRARLAIAEGRPNVTVGAAYEREEETTDIYILKFGFPLPLFNPNRGEADRVRFEARAATERVKALETAIAREVSGAKNELEILAERVRVLHDTSLARSEENLSLVAEAFQEGVLGLTDVIVYFTEAQNARRAAHESLIDWGRAVLELERAVGAPLVIEEKELHR
jgi:outer membrane protein TolC